ncbi:hypothetical protein PUN4_230114 [Paraburkholderia unamae]|nr:hypothetical protein PUN4_230114 [Paraburkholderia unamae]
MSVSHTRGILRRRRAGAAIPNGIAYDCRLTTTYKKTHREYQKTNQRRRIGPMRAGGGGGAVASTVTTAVLAPL